jgi:hypothetical protein
VNHEDNDVLKQFGEDLDELCICGGAEAQSVVRDRLRVAYEKIREVMSEEDLLAFQARFGNHQAITGKRIAFWEIPDDPPSSARLASAT